MAYRQSSENGARQLLQSILSERDWDRFTQTGTLEIAAKAGIYRVCTHGPTKILDSETRQLVTTTRLRGGTPRSERDRVIAEYLLIRNDEDLYWQSVNISPDTSGSRLYFSVLMAAVDAMLLMIVLAQLR
jgi:hypothetical protein